MGELVARKRKALGISQQEEFAEKPGVHIGTLSKIENGLFKKMSYLGQSGLKS